MVHSWISTFFMPVRSEMSAETRFMSPKTHFLPPKRSHFLPPPPKLLYSWTHFPETPAPSRLTPASFWNDYRQVARWFFGHSVTSAFQLRDLPGLVHRLGRKRDGRVILLVTRDFARRLGYWGRPLDCSWHRVQIRLPRLAAAMLLSDYAKQHGQAFRKPCFCDCCRN